MDMMFHGLPAASSLPACAHIPLIRLAPPRDRGEALRLRRLDRIRAHIDAVLSDPDLSARGAARALGMSVRNLHMTLQPSGETFGQLVQRRRLEACHALLCRPDNGASIADIAFACGFNSLSSFYRAFRRTFSACPRDMRPGEGPPVALAA